MNKEEILEKSRKENRNKDIYEEELIKQGSAIVNIVMVILATVFFVIQVLPEAESTMVYMPLCSVILWYYPG